MSALQLEARGGRAGSAAAFGAAGWLRLAAAPTFAVMALLTAAWGRGTPDMLCAAADWSPLGGMVPMYLLMSVFHLTPWLKLISGRMRRTRLRPSFEMPALIPSREPRPSRRGFAHGRETAPQDEVRGRGTRAPQHEALTI